MEDIILYNTKTHSLNTNNGILNEANLKFAKQTLLFDTIREHIELVKTKQGYPQNDISDVDMTIDCVVMSRQRYKELLSKPNIVNGNIAYNIEKDAIEFLKSHKLKS